ncbi:MAG: LPS export ABC transporter periplasmic protein LptC [Alphaproteobacteria bacterium]
MRVQRLALTAGLWLGAAALALFLFMERKEGPVMTLELDGMANLTNAELSAQAASVSATSVLVEPHFTGRDATGRSWDVLAKTASRTGTMGADEVGVEHVTATLIQPNGKPLTLAAEAGVYTKVSDTLVLNGNVVATGLGLTLKAPSAITNLATRHLHAPAPVALEGAFGNWRGRITGGAMEVMERGGDTVLTLQGRVHGHFEAVEQ